VVGGAEGEGVGPQALVDDPHQCAVGVLEQVLVERRDGEVGSAGCQVGRPHVLADLLDV
jgi:hypothetical protein